MSDLPEIGMAASSYIDFYQQQAIMLDQANRDPDPSQRLTALRAAGLAAGKMVMLALTAETVAEQLEQIVEFEPEPLNPQVEGMREAFQQMLDDPSGEIGGQHIDRNEVRKLLDSLPAKADYSIETREIAGFLLNGFRRYLDGSAPQPPMASDPGAEFVIDVLKRSRQVEAQPETPEPARPDTPPTPESSPEEPIEEDDTPEIDDGRMLVTVYSDLVLGFPDGNYKTLWRSLDTASTTYEDEFNIALTRAKALDFTSKIPEGEEVLTRLVWDASMPGDQPFHSPTWAHYYSDFLNNFSAPDGTILVKHRKPNVRRGVYGGGDVPFKVVFVDRPSGFEDNSHFALPENNIFFGRMAHMMNLLAGHSESDPLDIPAFLEAGVLTEEDLSRYDSPNSAFTGMVSQIRSSLRELGIDNEIIIKKDLHKDRVSEFNRREPVYWLEYGLPKTLKNQITQIVNLFSEHEEIVGSIGLGEDLTDIDSLLEMAEAYGDNRTVKLETQLASLSNLTKRETIEELLKCVCSSDPELNRVIEILSRLANDPETYATLIDQLKSEATKAPASEEEAQPSDTETESDSTSESTAADTPRRSPVEREREHRLERSIYYAPILAIAKKVIAEDALPKMQARGMLSSKKVSTQEIRSMFGLSDRQVPKQTSLIMSLALVSVLRKDREYTKILSGVNKAKRGELNDVAALAVQQLYVDYLKDNNIELTNGNGAGNGKH